MRSKLIVVGLIALLLSIGAWSSQGQTNKARNVSYEYHVISDPTWVEGRDAGLNTLNKFGAEGWEIIGAVQHDGANPPTLYLKRARR
jgi:hypothetical protein